jgi:hypothetical protein
MTHSRNVVGHQHGIAWEIEGNKKAPAGDINGARAV